MTPFSLCISLRVADRAELVQIASRGYAARIVVSSVLKLSAMNSYVEALIDTWKPDLSSDARAHVLSRVPAKCMVVSIPPNGIRADIFSCAIGPNSPGMIHGLSKEEALLLALLRFDDASPSFSETILYIASHIPPNTMSLTVPPSPFSLGAMVP